MYDLTESYRIAMAEKINNLNLSWTASSYTDSDSKHTTLAQTDNRGKSISEDTIDWT